MKKKLLSLLLLLGLVLVISPMVLSCSDKDEQQTVDPENPKEPDTPLPPVPTPIKWVENEVDGGVRSKFMQQSIIQFIENLNIVFPKEQEQYVYSYILNGSTGVIIQWIRSDYCIDENELVDLLFSINQSALVNLDIKPRI